MPKVHDMSSIVSRHRSRSAGIPYTVDVDIENAGGFVPRRRTPVPAIINQVLVNNRWYRCAATWDKPTGIFNIYINGVRDTSTAGTMSADNAAHVVDFGHMSVTGGINWFSGLMGPIGFYTR